MSKRLDLTIDHLNFLVKLCKIYPVYYENRSLYYTQHFSEYFQPFSWQSPGENQNQNLGSRYPRRPVLHCNLRVLMHERNTMVGRGCSSIISEYRERSTLILLNY